MSRIDLAKEFKKYASSDAFFYVTLDPERALGLEDVLPNYTIICPYKSQLTDKLRSQGVNVVILEEHVSAKEIADIVKKGTYGMLEWCKIPPRAHILVLKNSDLIETLCKRRGWHLLAPNAKIAEKFENKISQYEALKNIAPYPKSFIATASALASRFRSPRWSFGEAGGNDKTKNGELNVVLQFNRGHSGNSTFFIKSKENLKKLAKKYPKREVKISEYIKGRTYTLNCLVLKNDEILTGSLSEQITGLKKATNNPNTTCGNDFDSPKKLSIKTVNAIQEVATNTGKALYKNKYKGLFGIDVIIENNTNNVYFIELNTHQPASISFEAKLHRRVGKVPLMAQFILDKKMEKLPIILPISAKQIIYRNTTDKILKYKDIENEYIKKGLISRMKFVRPNEEVYRKQYISP